MIKIQLQNIYQSWIRPITGSLSFEIAVGLFIFLVLWSMVWKGFALWRAGKRGDLIWFIALLFVNTLGLLEMLYIFHFSKRPKPEKMGQDNQK